MILAKPQQVLPSDRLLVAGRISPDGAIVAAGGIEGTVLRWRFAGQALEPLPPLTGHHAHVGALAFHRTEPWLYTGDSWGRLRCQTFVEDNPSVAWELEHAHDGWLRQLSVGSDGRHVATCGRDGMARLWTAQGKLVAEYKHNDDLFALTFTPDSQQIVLGDQHGRLLVWDFAGNRIVRKLDATIMFKTDRLQEICGLRTLAFSSDHQLLLAAGTIPDHGATIQSTPLLLAFDFATGKQHSKFTFGDPKEGFIEDLAVHPDGTLIGVTSGNPGTGKVLLFKAGDKEPIAPPIQLANCQAVALHPDGTRFIVISTQGRGGNGKTLDKDGNYAANTSPINLFAYPGGPKPGTAADLDSLLGAQVK